MREEGREEMLAESLVYNGLFYSPGCQKRKRGDQQEASVRDSGNAELDGVGWGRIRVQSCVTA